MKKHYNLTTTEDNGKSITTTNTSSEYPDEIVRLLALAGQGMPQVAPAPAEDDCGCGCGETPCGCGSMEEAEYEATPANDKLDLDDFSKKTADSISRQKKTLRPSNGDNPLEYSVNEEEIYDALMSEAQEYGMFSDRGNAFVEDTIGGIYMMVAQGHLDKNLAMARLEQELDDLAEDEPDMEEAADTEVRERAMRELEGLLAGLE
jgi:hypothetical protein